MSKYTTTIANMSEYWTGSDRMTGAWNNDNKIKAAQEHIFDFSYPVYNEEQKDRVEKLFIKKYFRREIAYDTFSEWKWYLEEKLNEIMPKYIVLYEREENELPFDNFYYDIKESGTGGAKGAYTTSGTGSSESADSDMPQGSLDNFRDDKYLTSANKSSRKNDSKTTQESNNEHQNQSYRHGNNSIQLNWHADMTYSRDYKTVDMRILDELSSLFLKIW